MPEGLELALSNEIGLDLQTIARVGRLWRLRLVSVHPELSPAGSPDRSLARVVAGTEEGLLYLVERLSPATAPRKMAIAALLQALQDTGMHGINPYLATGDGHHVVPLGADYWQISPYLEGAPLPRPGWVWHAWRGAALARFLCDLRDASRQVRLPAEAPYSPHAFCQDLLARLETHRPSLAQCLSPTVNALVTDWLPPEGTLVSTFCHGDPHPLNVIWAPEGQGIAAVIDWEFCGIKPGAYDAALLIGCVGIEDPGALIGPFVQALLSGLRRGGHPAGAEPALWALVVATRFGWLSDWLRRGDEEMVALEQDYMRVLIEQRGVLERTWSAA